MAAVRCYSERAGYRDRRPDSRQPDRLPYADPKSPCFRVPANRSPGRSASATSLRHRFGPGRLWVRSRQVTTASTLRKGFRYAVRFADIVSPTFAIVDDAYAGVPEKLLDFMRCAAAASEPGGHRKCQQQDAFDGESAQAFDLTGGWHDAADRIT